MDCMQGMKEFPDKYFDLAIVDVPYGIGESGGKNKSRGKLAKPNDIILDTHVGSASSLIACYNTNHKFVGFELDEYYYKVSKQRLDTEMAQMRLSDFIGDTV